MEMFLFLNFSLFAILGAVGLVAFKTPIHGALSLIVTMVSIAGLYLLLYSKTLFLIQIVVYAGAIMVLCVFVMMFFNIKSKENLHKFDKKSILISGIVVIFFIAVVEELWTLPGQFLAVGVEFKEMKTLGVYLFSNWGIAFEAISILLTTALLGVVSILRGRKDA